MNADSTLLPAYGVGFSGNIPIKSDQFPLEFNLRFKDVGLLFEPGGSAGILVPRRSINNRVTHLW